MRWPFWLFLKEIRQHSLENPGNLSVIGCREGLSQRAPTRAAYQSHDNRRKISRSGPNSSQTTKITTPNQTLARRIPRQNRRRRRRFACPFAVTGGSSQAGILGYAVGQFIHVIAICSTVAIDTQIRYGT